MSTTHQLLKNKLNKIVQIVHLGCSEDPCQHMKSEISSSLEMCPTTGKVILKCILLGCCIPLLSCSSIYIGPVNVMYLPVTTDHLITNTC